MYKSPLDDRLLDNVPDKKDMNDIGCIILAAGANERLKGLVPSFMKPLILVNGQPLILHAVNHATQFWNCRRDDIAVVAAPQNISGIAQLLGEMPDYVIQPTPSGVVDAISRALPFMTHRWTLILMADNTFAGGDPITYDFPEYNGIIGIRTDIQSMRFTRLKIGPGESPRVLSRNSPQMGDAVWIGPLALRTELLKKQIVVCETIEDLINVVTSNGTRLFAMSMACSDLGVPEELEKI